MAVVVVISKDVGDGFDTDRNEVFGVGRWQRGRE